MKKFTRVLCLVLAIAMLVVCFTGCKKKNDDVYVVGATGPLTGDASSYGISVEQGAKLAFKEINEKGGLNGKQFKFIMKDDKATPADATTAYDSLYDEGMQISLGSTTSGSCEAFAARAAKDNVFFITPSASAANVIENRSNAFRVCFGDPDQGVLAAQEIVKNYTKIGCIYDTSDPYSSGIYEAFKAEMANLGVTYVERTFDKDTNKDFSAQVEALKDCEVIFCPFYYKEAGLVAKACAAKELDNILLFGCDGFDGVKDQIDDSVKNPIKYITPFDVNSDDEDVKAFVAAYKKEYNVEPDQFAADAYDAAYIVYEAMKAAGIDDTSIDPSKLCDAVVEAITSEDFKYDGLTGGMTWDESGACTKEPNIVDLSK